MVKIDIFGIRPTAAFLTLKKIQIDKNTEKGLKDAAIYMQGEVKSSIAGRRAEPTSVDTGRFLNSVNFKVGKDDAIVFSDVPYAKHLEHGTSRIKPRRHFNNSKDRNKQEIRNILKRKII